MEYKEENADFEVCVPLRRAPPAADPAEAAEPDAGGEARSAGGVTRLPIEEVYLRGPGMLLPRSPGRYLTEIRLVLK